MITSTHFGQIIDLLGEQAAYDIAWARETGLRVGSVDTVLWRACAVGVLNPRTGAIAEAI